MPDHLLEYAMMEKIYILRQPFTCAMRTQKLLEQIPLLLNFKKQQNAILQFCCFIALKSLLRVNILMLTGGIKIQTYIFYKLTDQGNFADLMV